MPPSHQHQPDTCYALPYARHCKGIEWAPASRESTVCLEKAGPGRPAYCAGRKVNAGPMGRGLGMCQKGYREEVIFELIIAFHKVIKNISNRKERKNKVAKMWNRH